MKLQKKKLEIYSKNKKEYMLFHTNNFYIILLIIFLPLLCIYNGFFSNNIKKLMTNNTFYNKEYNFEKNKLQEEKNRLQEEKNKFQEEKNKCQEEKNKLLEEKNKLNEEKDKLKKEKDKFKKEKKKLKIEEVKINEESIPMPQDVYKIEKFSSREKSFKKAKNFLEKCINGTIFQKIPLAPIENPIATAIIPLYNGKQYISKAIKSIQNQNIMNIEIIIVNDKSTDEPLPFLKEIQKK